MTPRADAFQTTGSANLFSQAVFYLDFAGVSNQNQLKGMTMKRQWIVFLSVFFFFKISSSVYSESSSPLSSSVSLPVYSAYVWRGIVVTDGPVLQPSYTVSKNGFSINTWTNYNLTDRYSDETKNEISEVDLTLSYTKTLGEVALGITYAEYLFPHQTVTGATGDRFSAHGTREVQLSAALPNLPLSPSLTLVRDIDEIDGFYALFSLSKTLELTREISASFAFSTGAGDKEYNSGYFGIHKTKFDDGNFSASLPVKLTDNTTFTPLIQYTWLWDSEIKTQAASLYKDDSSLWGGVTFTVNL